MKCILPECNCKNLKRYFLSFSFYFLLLIWAASTCQAARTSLSNRSIHLSTDSKIKTVKEYGKLPLGFEKNLGQTETNVKYLSRGMDYAIYLNNKEMILKLSRPKVDQYLKEDGYHRKRKDNLAFKKAELSMEIVNANPNSEIISQNKLSGIANYFIGNEPEKWITNVPTCAKVKYKAVYPGIDLIFYGNQQQLEYDFVVSPGADPDGIRLEFKGVTELEIDNQGNLLLRIEGGKILFKKPVIYQDEKNGRKYIKGSYKLFGNNQVGFNLASYDDQKPVTIDPVLIYSTYFGGSVDEKGLGIAVDPNGNACIIGSPGYDLGNGSPLYDKYPSSSDDIFVFKIDSTGSNLLYSTYIGGSSTDTGYDIAVDASGNAYITGHTDSLNFPATTGAFQKELAIGGNDAFVAKISSTGTLIYATYLGSYEREYGYGIAVDNDGNAYVAGETWSDDFPTVNAIQNNISGSINGFVCKLNPSGSALVFSTYLGGSNSCQCHGIAVDASGNAYVTGLMYYSTDFPTTSGAYQTSPGDGSIDAFITKIHASGFPVIYSTYLGGNGDDIGYDIAVDTNGNAYVTGATDSTDLATVTAYQPVHAMDSQFDKDAFVAKINATGSNLVYATYLGGSGNEMGTGIAVDSSGNAHVTGYTDSTDFPIESPISPIQPGNGGGEDAFVAMLNPTGSSLIHSTYLGGAANDRGLDIDVDTADYVYVTGSTRSINFPVKSPINPLQSGSGGSVDAFVTRIITFADSDNPSVIISNPQNGSTLDQLYEINGTASDVTTIITKVELQITDGTYYLNQNLQFVSTPSWVPADGTNNWSFNTSTVNWTSGSTYSIKARSTDMVGNISSIVFISVDMSIGQAYTTLSLELSSQTILNNGNNSNIDAVGKLTRLPDIGTNLNGLTINLIITAPDQTSTTHYTNTYDSYGHYQFSDVSGFTQTGMYTVKVSYESSGLLYGSESGEKSVLVGASAGYAIIIQGKIDNEEGMASHLKTTDRIYQRLKNRGFSDDNIYYFNYAYDSNPADNPEGVDAVPSKSDIQNKVENWAPDRLNGSPAPFYIIMVDHGNRDTFYLDHETITPGDLDAWLNAMESRLNTSALAEKRIVIIGACYSGSFISALSGDGRVIITSSTSDEESYKGPLEPDGIRSGEFFMEEFFQQLRRGESFKDAFVYATEKTEIFTLRGNGSNNFNSSFLDGAMQHPLLEDNGDGFGSNLLSDGYGDGMLSAQLYLGFGLTYDANAPQNSAEIIQVTETLYLGTATSSAQLKAFANNDSRADSVWVEVRPPSKILSSSGGTDQLELELDNHFMTLNEPESRWEIIYDSFSESGKYEVLYFVKDNIAKDIASMKRTIVYKDRVGNNPPSNFNLLFPQNSSEKKTVLLFDWEDATDQDQGDMITYNLIVATDNLFNNVVLKKEEIPVSTTFIDDTAGLEDMTTYYWKIEAIDSFGAKTSSSETWSFQTNNTNSFPGFIKGIVYNGLDNLGIEEASLTATPGDASVTTLSNGYFIMVLPAGTTAISGTKSGYQNISILDIEVKSGSATKINIMMLPEGTTKDMEAPVSSASPTGGSYTESQAVAITCSDTGGSGCNAVYYTTGNKEPTIGSSTYLDPIIIDSTTTLKFFAMDNAGNSEPVNTKIYTIKPVKGNVNGDDVVDLIDVILALKVTGGMNSSGENIKITADINGNGKIGLEEVVYILQKVSNLR